MTTSAVLVKIPSIGNRGIGNALEELKHFPFLVPGRFKRVKWKAEFAEAGAWIKVLRRILENWIHLCTSWIKWIEAADADVTYIAKLGCDSVNEGVVTKLRRNAAPPSGAPLSRVVVDSRKGSEPALLLVPFEARTEDCLAFEPNVSKPPNIGV